MKQLDPESFSSVQEYLDEANLRPLSVLRLIELVIKDAGTKDPNEMFIIFQTGPINYTLVAENKENGQQHLIDIRLAPKSHPLWDAQDPPFPIAEG